MRRISNKLTGGALISALFIAAIVSMLATALAVQERLVIHAVGLGVDADRSYLSLELMQLAAKKRIADYAARWMVAENNKTAVVTPLHTALPVMQLENATLRGIISDEQAKYNLNNLTNTNNQTQFTTLLRTVCPDVLPENASAIASAIMAWMTTGTDDADYLSQNPPYRSSRQVFADITELRLIIGVTPKIYNCLKPYVTALPVMAATQVVSSDEDFIAQPGGQPTQSTVTPVNINTVSAPVLMAVNPVLTAAQATSLIACRQRFGGTVNSIAQFTSSCAQPINITTLNNLATQSQYFLVHAERAVKDHRWALNRLMVTHLKKNNTLSVSTVWQSFE